MTLALRLLSAAARKVSDEAAPGEGRQVSSSCQINSRRRHRDRAAGGAFVVGGQGRAKKLATRGRIQDQSAGAPRRILGPTLASKTSRVTP